MRQLTKKWILYSALAATALLAISESAQAVPSYSRRYSEACSTCHTMWGALSPAGLTFKLSGYRAIFGKNLNPTTPDTQIAKGVTVPSTLPLSFVTGIGVDGRSETRSTSGAGGSTEFKSTGTTLALEDASIFLTSPLGKHLSAFVEFPMYETRAWEFTPTGNYEARFNQPGGQVKFNTESPAFEVAKFFWNNIAGDGAPRDAVNFLGGITHLPLAYSPGKVRLSVNQYLIYERTALDLISPRKLADGVFSGDPNDNVFRLSEPQVIAEIYGMSTFGKPVTEVGNKETAWGEYHLGLSNGSNAKAANNTQKDFYGRGVLRYYGQSFGVLGVYSPDTYNDDLRSRGSIGTNDVAGSAEATGIMSGAQSANKSTRYGVDATLSLAPWGVPLSLDNQYMSNKETNPTGFGKEFKWKGGFHQVNWRISKTSVAYARYDYVKGDSFDDTGTVVNGIVGITRTNPKEEDFVLGYQALVEENIKFVAEFRNHKFDDSARGPMNSVSSAALGPTAVNEAHLKDNGFTIRLMFGF